VDAKKQIPISSTLLPPLPALDIVAACLVSPKTNSPSPAQRSVKAGAQKANSYQFNLSIQQQLPT
jgi:hypothetical protein